MMCLGVCYFGSNFFGTLWASWTSWTSWKFISFVRLGKFSFIICSNKFSISCCCSSPSGTPVIQILECFRLSQRILSLSSFFWILVSSFWSGWMFIYSFCSKLLLWSLVSFLSLLVSFLSLNILLYFILGIFICSFIFWPSSISSVSILITKALNYPSGRLAISSQLSSEVLLCSFTGALFLCLGIPDEL